MTSKDTTTALAQAQQQIEELETKVAFQEHTIESLNDALTSQQKQIDELSFKMKHVIDRMKTMQTSNIARQSEETPPPHY